MVKINFITEQNNIADGSTLFYENGDTPSENINERKQDIKDNFDYNIKNYENKCLQVSY